MIEALLALALGGALARTVLWPIEQWQIDRQEAADQRRAEEIAADIRRRAEDAARGATGAEVPDLR